METGETTASVQQGDTLSRTRSRLLHAFEKLMRQPSVASEWLASYDRIARAIEVPKLALLAERMRGAMRIAAKTAEISATVADVVTVVLLGTTAAAALRDRGRRQAFDVGMQKINSRSRLGKLLSQGGKVTPEDMWREYRTMKGKSALLTGTAGLGALLIRPASTMSRFTARLSGAAGARVAHVLNGILLKTNMPDMVSQSPAASPIL